MKKKLRNIINNSSSVSAIILILALWQILSSVGIVPKYMLPSPFDVVAAFINDFSLLMSHAKTTLTEALLGLTVGTAFGFVIAVLMDRFALFEKSVYPIIILTQTVPTVAIAPLLVLWLGYGLLPKVTLIVLTTFFPITVSLLEGFHSADIDAINLLKAMGGNRLQCFVHIKLPSALNQFFSGLKISVSYSVVGAVIAEWLGGLSGLGVYMTRVRKSYSFDKMFAVIFFISIISLILMFAVSYLSRAVMPWENKRIERTWFKVKNKLMFLITITILSVFMLTSCAAETPKTEEESIKIDIVLDWTPNTNHTGLYVAQSKGFFEEEGLEVVIMQPPEGGAEAIVGGGGAEFGIGFQDYLAPNFASNTPMPITAVAAIIQHNTSGIISLKEDGIDTPSKLSGHTYATWNLPIELAIIEKIVQDDGGNFEDINLVPSTVTDVITALQTDIDSVWIYYAWDGIATKVKGLETNYLNFADYGKELDYYSPVLFVNDDYANSNPQIVKKVLSAVKKGYEFAIENPEDAAQILLEAAPELDAEIVVESQKWLADQYIADAPKWGYIDQERWDAFYGWLFENNLIEKEIPKGAGFTNDYLPE